MLILELKFCGVIWPFALALKWKISTKKMSFDEGKETNKSKEERQDPFLCRKENKTTFLKVCLRLSELWFVIMLISTCFATACYVFFYRWLLYPYKCLSEIENMCQCDVFPRKSRLTVIDARRSCCSIVCGFRRWNNFLGWRELFTKSCLLACEQAHFGAQAFAE